MVGPLLTLSLRFFVDTNANPPRSIWVHPYDDPQFLETLTPEERKKHSRLHRTMTLEDLAAESSDDEAGDNGHGHHKHTAAGSAALPARPKDDGPKGIHKFGRKMKDKITASSHEDRERQRRQREEQERRAYEMHMHARQAMVCFLIPDFPSYLSPQNPLFRFTFILFHLSLIAILCLYNQSTDVSLRSVPSKPANHSSS
jgi:hypothetical protein